MHPLTLHTAGGTIQHCIDDRVFNKVDYVVSGTHPQLGSHSPSITPLKGCRTQSAAATGAARAASMHLTAVPRHGYVQKAFS